MSFWADVVLFVHFSIVLFIVGGLVLIWVGAALQWQWIRNAKFRFLHLAAMLIVALESIVGVACPLTLWENSLRGTSSELGFIQSWVSRLLFYDLAPWVFTLTYVGVAMAILLTLIGVPVNDKHALFKNHIDR